MFTMENCPLVSVIVVACDINTNLIKSLKSISNQTYKNIEIIIVNDCADEKTEKIIRQFLEENDNAKCIKHLQPKGLFKSRLSGAEETEGEYIIFLDENDSLSCDWIRLCAEKAVKENADIIIGDLAVIENNKEYFYNLDPIRMIDDPLEGKEICDLVFDQHGLFWGLNIITNRLFSRELWNKAVNNVYETISLSLSANENFDMMLSTMLFLNSQKLAFVHHSMYFYDLSRNLPCCSNNDTVYKNVITLKHSFEAIERVLADRYENYAINIAEWKKLFGRKIVSNILKNMKSTDNSDLINLLKDSFFDGDEIISKNIDDDYFYSFKTEIHLSFSWFENIKKYIKSPECRYVSFDIFDTLILRPFFVPSDLFGLMNKYFAEITGANSYISFSQIRIEAEKRCRDTVRKLHPNYEDVTLTEIYEQIENDYTITHEQAMLLYKKEIELELKYCYKRKSGAELFELAKFCGKKILLLSDMYLEEDTVNRILKKNGYDGYELFLSSSLRRGKWTTNLFRYVINTLKIKNELGCMCHIGDNWVSDVENPQKTGLASFHISKPIDLFMNLNPSIYCGESYANVFNNGGVPEDMANAVWEFMGTRTILAVVANYLFDYPDVSFNCDSDFNISPVYVGYYLLGTHIYAICDWLYSDTKNSDVKKIHFVSRDGYVVKQAYDMFVNGCENAPASNYLYLSRKSLAMLDVKSNIDLYSFVSKLNVLNYSPVKFLNIFRQFINSEDYEMLLSLIKKKYKKSENINFGSKYEFELYLKDFIRDYSGYIHFDECGKQLRNYFAKLIEYGDCIFDVGYSGRAEDSLSSILGFPINSYYLHSNSEMLNYRMEHSKFCTKTFYGFKPAVTGVMREHMLMQLGPSNIGYDLETMKPIFEEYNIDYQTKFITQIVQNSALKFVRDIVDKFAEDRFNLYFRKEDISRPLEYYYHFSKPADRMIFSTLQFEDDFGEGASVRAVDLWNKLVNGRLDIVRPVNTDKLRVAENEKISNIINEKYQQKVLLASGKKRNTVSKTIIFNDAIAETDSTNMKFDKCSGNTNNIIAAETLKSQIYHQSMDNWYMTNPGEFNDCHIFIQPAFMTIQENADLTYLNNILDNIKDGVFLPVGIGFSTELQNKKFILGQESIKALCRVAERCKSVGVSGEYSAELLNSYGIKNIDIIGAPLMYLNSGVVRKVKKNNTVNKAAATFKPFYGKMSAKEKELLNYYMDNNFTLIDNTYLELTKENLDDDKMFYELKRYEGSKKVFFDYESWNKELGKYDFVMGMNITNNILAIKCGIPTVNIVWDTYTKEVCDYFRMQYIEISQFDSSIKLNDYYETADFSTTAIDEKYSAYCSFLHKNGVSNKNTRNIIVK